MDIKSLAKALPLHGQRAVSSALTALSRAGHLHRARVLAATGDNGTRWVFRTYWSSAARGDAWWAALMSGGEAPEIAQGGDVPAPGGGVASDVNPTPDHTTPSTDVPAPAEPSPTTASPTTASPATASPATASPATAAPASPMAAPAKAAPTEPHAATAYRVLARLGSIESRLALSAADCDALTELVTPWLERGASTVSVIQALTAGLPDAVHAPRGFVARRLRDKLPPQPAPTPVPAAFDELPSGRPRRLMPECTECGVPGRPEAFVGGLCRGCRTASPGAPVTPPRGGGELRRQNAVVLSREALAARDRRQSATSRPLAVGQP
ncbi:hypothetical protein M2271_001432 [Streptomyces sp. LBL]|uniref:MarR family transcriptional regulator n=1 Tax=Streptomyces sp. LBL TaxID=2940562 RepID=UPI0024769CC1|nr:MarR family transcriptional regulator [Streptomyces sp. LBL]MDH6623640.1 hypothetical protein [Streptomyces sp. LBL]